MSINLIYKTCESSVTPLLSIAIPTFKRFNLLRETLQSLSPLRFLFPFEVLVVDNDPESDINIHFLMDEFQELPLYYFKNVENLGMFGNWNQCLKLSRGKYVTILHDDDLLLPEFACQMNDLLSAGRLEHEIAAFSVKILDQRPGRPSNENSRIRSFLRKLKYEMPWSTKSSAKCIADLFFANPFMGTLGTVMNRELALSNGGFDANWYPIADYEFWCRWAANIGCIPSVKTTVGKYRMQENETLRLDVREKFVSESTKLRRRLVAEHHIPYPMGALITPVAWVQKHSINCDWRTEGESRYLLFRIFILKPWTYLSQLAVCTMKVAQRHKPTQK